MAQCTEAERRWLDAVKDDNKPFEAMEELRYQVAMEKIPADFVQQLVSAFKDIARALERRDALIDAASKIGFSGGSKGGIVRLWDIAEKQAKKELEAGR